MYAARELAKLGYEFAAVSGGAKSDLRLRQTQDVSKGFEFKARRSIATYI